MRDLHGLLQPGGRVRRWQHSPTISQERSPFSATTGQAFAASPPELEEGRPGARRRAREQLVILDGLERCTTPTSAVNPVNSKISLQF